MEKSAVVGMPDDGWPAIEGVLRLGSMSRPSQRPLRIFLLIKYVIQPDDLGPATGFRQFVALLASPRLE